MGRKKELKAEIKTLMYENATLRQELMLVIAEVAKYNMSISGIDWQVLRQKRTKKVR